MVLEVLRRLLGGFGTGGLLTLIILSVFVARGIEVPVVTVWASLLGSMIMGSYFSVSSFIFEYDRWSPLKQLVIHFGLSIVLFFCTALWAGWLPLRVLPILMGLVIFIVIYSIFWLGFRYYFNKQARDLNDSMNK